MRLVLISITVYTKIEMPSYTRSKDMIGLKTITRVSCRWQTRATRCIMTNRKRSDSAHAQYSASHYGRPNQTISSTRLSCWIQISTVDVINIAVDHQKFITLTGELSWQRLRRSAVPEIWLCPAKFKRFTRLNHGPFRDALPSTG